jgi:hypothetical protein
MASDSTSVYQTTYTSYTGTDIVASILGVPIGSMLSISYSIQREKAGIYTMGSPDPRSISRGKRGIAGSLIFQIFDKDALFDIMWNHPQEFWFATRNSNWQIAPQSYGAPNPNNWLNKWENQELAHGKYQPFYADQIPPFDITLSFLNEMGNIARMDIKGVEILNEGMGMSVEDMAIEQAMTFIARSIGKIVPNGPEVTQEHIFSTLSTPVGSGGPLP